MIAKVKRPDGLEDFEALRVKNFKAGIIVDVINLTAGLDMAVSQIKKGEITKKAQESLRDLTAQTYSLFAYRLAFGILQDENIATDEDQVLDFRYRFDTPDDTHDDLVIYYKRA